MGHKTRMNYKFGLTNIFARVTRTVSEPIALHLEYIHHFLPLKIWCISKNFSLSWVISLEIVFQTQNSGQTWLIFNRDQFALCVCVCVHARAYKGNKKLMLYTTQMKYNMKLSLTNVCGVSWFGVWTLYRKYRRLWNYLSLLSILPKELSSIKEVLLASFFHFLSSSSLGKSWCALFQYGKPMKGVVFRKLCCL